MAIVPTNLMPFAEDELGPLPVPHTTGDHRLCGPACHSRGVDLRPTLGFWEKMLTERPDPSTFITRLRAEVSDIVEACHLQKMRSTCRNLGLPTKGSRTQLQDRLRKWLDEHPDN